MTSGFLKAALGGTGLWLAGCGGDAAEVVSRDEAANPQDGFSEEAGSSDATPRQGPAGCYLPAEMRCDCQVSEEQCESDPSGTWVEEGCASCAD